MSDLINRQDAIDEVKKWIETYSSGRGGQRERDAIKHVISGIKKLPSVQQWIPCNEPPEEDGYYIVYAPTYSGGSSGGKENHNGVMFSSYKNGKWSIEHGYHKRPNCVRAWMPLPERWKGE